MSSSALEGPGPHHHRCLCPGVTEGSCSPPRGAQLSLLALTQPPGLIHSFPVSWAVRGKGPLWVGRGRVSSAVGFGIFPRASAEQVPANQLGELRTFFSPSLQSLPQPSTSHFLPSPFTAFPPFSVLYPARAAPHEGYSQGKWVKVSHRHPPVLFYSEGRER